MPHASTTPADTSRCPLCGQPNRCAIAAGRPPESCWCMGRTIDRAALGRVPPSARGVACICPACGAPDPAEGPQSGALPGGPPI